MKQKSLGNTRIRGIQCAVPRERISNDYFRAFFKVEEIDKTAGMTGVKSRRFVDDQTCTSDLCVAAARKLLSDLSWEPSTIDGLVFVTQTPDYRLPATSCVMQDELGISTDCAAFDVNLGCSGYVYGLWIAGNLMTSGCMKRLLLLAGDTTSKCFSPEDRSTAMLFGDAGTATALEYDEKAPEMAFILGTDGGGKQNLIIPSGGYRERSTPESLARVTQPDGGIRSKEDVYMDGGEIFNFTIRRVPALVKTLLESAGAVITDLDYVVFHQANEFIMRHLAKKLKLAPSQVPMSIGKYGNTSSASIPLTIAAVVSEELASQEKTLALVGFGVGYSWGGVLMKMGPLESLGLVEV